MPFLPAPGPRNITPGPASAADPRRTAGRPRDGGTRYRISTSDIALGDAAILAGVRVPASFGRRMRRSPDSIRLSSITSASA
ncbi:hypothetical protein GCM10010094_20980 [Streptomyces flaveus]|uniref:Uncharacterized protein n=1 Tax=Streptomyces flaveus TaxID=66370 RepID=A0A917QNI4_9ACTN|nr:hypothetical protein GCM10010094_20980 [Streptomyces flaveus]